MNKECFPKFSLYDRAEQDQRLDGESEEGTAAAGALDPVCSGFARRRSPQIAQSRVVHDFIKGRITLFEFAANVPDDRSDIYSKASLAGTGDKAFVVQAVINRAIDISRPAFEAKSCTILNSPTVSLMSFSRHKARLTADRRTSLPQTSSSSSFGVPGTRCGLDQSLETADENLDAASLVHEVRTSRGILRLGADARNDQLMLLHRSGQDDLREPPCISEIRM